MKKSFFYLMTLAGMLFFSLTTAAQQAKQTGESPKAPQTVAKVLQSDQGSNATEPIVTPVVPARSLPSTADAKASQAPMKITKGNEVQPTKESQANSQPISSVPPRTDNLVLPKSHQTEIPVSKSSPTPTPVGGN